MGDALFTQDSIDTLIPILRNFTNFNRLELYGTELSTQNACNIISCIPHLQYLDISFNELEIEGFEETMKCLPISTSYFAFRNNRLVDADVTRIVAAMKTAAHVKFIDLNDNNFSDEGAENLCEQIASLQTKVEISRYYAGDDA
jgi:Ran GTPase-activating protein (RanGAP) involved in mRNA processing and transport